MCVFTINCFKDNNKTAHWVGYSKLRFLDIDDLFKRTLHFDEKEASLTGNIKEEEHTVKNTTDGARKNAKEHEINDKYNEKVVTIE